VHLIVTRGKIFYDVSPKFVFQGHSTSARANSPHAHACVPGKDQSKITVVSLSIPVATILLQACCNIDVQTSWK